MPENTGRSYPDLEGKVVLVTGAAQGMGAAHARRLSASGATVAVNDREASAELAALASELSGLAVPGDVSDPDQVRALVQRVEQELGPVDVLVANHAFMTMGPFLDADPEDWWKVIDTNLGGTFHLVQAVLPGMRRRGAGRIVVISSEWGVTGWPDATAYSASKAGLISLVKTLGRELAPEGIIVNAVAPGVTDTPQLEVDARSAGISLDEMRAVYAGSIPLGRIGTSPEIAAAVALLCDFRLSAIIGQVVQVNGGSTRGRA
ncbi:SDR family oxidoreductase [Cryobacterium sp. Sr8]|uniref:SDR family NAD(P)-dependent oxidoreductase n=1 Tax=Cryobacterium sp. Sr8 TaxID=1259203 RepID=UPI00106BA013|nr:SDR family oxidoreductase [Cryobacterium sp. Sr8]TFD75218.1 SDR family oxidoreductase [Cryobacterium sp. Sr8]